MVDTSCLVQWLQLGSRVKVRVMVWVRVKVRAGVKGVAVR